MKSTIYEIGSNGKLVESVDKFTDLTPGTLIEWGGNAGFPATLFCILRRHVSTFDGRTSYECFNVDKPGNNALLQRVEARSIKEEGDPSLWHSQHYFLQPDRLTDETVQAYAEYSDHLREDLEAHQAAEKAEADRLEAIGRELWPALLGNCAAVIVAEFEVNDSDPLTDYFGSHTTRRIILAPSTHKRDLFPELRKAADRRPETAHLGTGKGRFSPRVVIGADFVSYGSCYYEGAKSPWHNELQQDENGNEPTFTTRPEAESFIASKGDPCNISFDGLEVPFRWEIREEEIEHREKYSMGKGYYLSAGNGYHGWTVSKETFYNGAPTREFFICLAQCHDHLQKPEAKPAPKASAKAETTPANVQPATGFELSYERDWTWIHFSSKPAAEIIAALKNAGGRFSGRRVAWYFTSHVTAEQIGLA